MNAVVDDSNLPPRSRLWLSCAEATRLASAALDRPLTRTERISLRIHLAVCGLCRRYRRQLGLLRNIMRAQGRRVAKAATPVLSPETRVRLKSVLRGSA